MILLLLLFVYEFTENKGKSQRKSTYVIIKYDA